MISTNLRIYNHSSKINPTRPRTQCASQIKRTSGQGLTTKQKMTRKIQNKVRGNQCKFSAINQYRLDMSKFKTNQELDLSLTNSKNKVEKEIEIEFLRQ